MNNCKQGQKLISHPFPSNMTNGAERQKISHSFNKFKTKNMSNDKSNNHKAYETPSEESDNSDQEMQQTPTLREQWQLKTSNIPIETKNQPN